MLVLVHVRNQGRAIVIIQQKLSPFWAEQTIVGDPLSLEPALYRRSQDSETVLDALSEVNRRCIRKVARGTRQLSDAEPEA